MNVNIRLRNIAYIVTVGLIIWLLISVRDMLTPFILAMIFAYVFNPLTNFFNHKLKITRAVSIFIVYVVIITCAGVLITSIAKSIISESQSISKTFDTFNKTINNAGGPDWLRIVFADYVSSFRESQIPTEVSFPVFTKAFSGIINLFVFLFSAFFFLKDSRKIPRKIVSLAPYEYRPQAQELITKINTVLSRYLRGQIILVAAMMAMLFTIFSILGVKNALTLSFMTAIFEIVPIIGPIVATIFGTFLVIVSGGISNFQLTEIQTIIVVLSVFISTRYFQDYVLQPLVIGKATELHPLLILFSVIAGERLYGILGVIIAVPVAASIKIFYQYLFDYINKNPRK